MCNDPGGIPQTNQGVIWHVMRLSILRPEFLCMTAGLEGKTLAVKNKKNNKKKRNPAQKPRGNGARL